MKKIFTYPANAATDYIDPLYVGNSTSGFTRRVDELLAGTYKDWVNLDPVSDLGTTTSEAMQNFSAFENYFDSVKHVSNIAMYDLWRNPIVLAKKSPTAGPNAINGGTINQVEDTITTETTHNFQDGDLAVIKGVDGLWGQFYNDKDLYVKRVDANTMKFSLDSSLSPLIDIPLVINYTNSLANTEPLLIDPNWSKGAYRNNYPIQPFYEAVQFYSPEYRYLAGDTITFDPLTSGVNENLDGVYYLKPIPEEHASFTYNSGFIEYYDITDRYYLYTDAALTDIVTGPDVFIEDTGFELTLVPNTFPMRVETTETIPSDESIQITRAPVFAESIGKLNPFGTGFSARQHFLKPVTGVPNTYEIYGDPDHLQPFTFNQRAGVTVKINLHDTIRLMDDPVWPAGVPLSSATQFPNGLADIDLRQGARIKITAASDLNLEQIEYVDYYVKDVVGQDYFELYKDEALTIPATKYDVTPADDEYVRVVDDLTVYRVQNIDSPDNQAVATHDNVWFDIDAGDELTLSTTGTSYNRTKAANVVSQTFDFNDYSGIPSIYNTTNLIRVWSNIAFEEGESGTPVNISGATAGNTGLSGQYTIFPTGIEKDGYKEYRVSDGVTNDLEYPLDGGAGGVVRSFQPRDYTVEPNTTNLVRVVGIPPADTGLGPSQRKITLKDPVMDVTGNTIIPAETRLWLEYADANIYGRNHYFVYDETTKNKISFAATDYNEVAIVDPDFNTSTGIANVDMGASTYSDGQEVRLYQLAPATDGGRNRWYRNYNRNFWSVSDGLENMRDLFDQFTEDGEKFVTFYLKFLSGTTYELYQDSGLTNPLTASDTDWSDSAANPTWAPFTIEYDPGTSTHDIVWGTFDSGYGPEEQFPNSRDRVVHIEDDGGFFTNDVYYIQYNPTTFVWSIHANQDFSDTLSYPASSLTCKMYPARMATNRLYWISLVDTSTPVEFYPMVAGEMSVQKLSTQNDNQTFKTWKTWYPHIEVPNYTSVKPLFYPTTQGSMSAEINFLTATAPTTGIIELSPNGNITYNVTSVDIVMPGTKEYKYLSGPDTYSPGAIIDAEEYWEPGATSITTHDPADTKATFTVSVGGGVFGGYLDGVSLTSAGAYSSPNDMLLIVENAPDTYTPPTPTPAEQQDTFDTQDYWDNLGNDDRKQWPRHVTPSSAQIVQSSPSIVNVSQNGVKFTKTSSFTKWKLEVTYPPMSADDFRKFHAVSQAVNGQATPFKFFFKSKEGDDILWNDFAVLGSSDVLMHREDVSAGDKVILVEGLDSFESNAFVEGEVLQMPDNNQNGNLNTVITGTDANVFGEAKIRLGYPLRNSEGSGATIYKHPESCIVTLSEDDFQYSVDYNSLYYLTVSFDLDGWK